MTNPPQQAVTMTPRQRMILNAVIERYIATGEPVASQTIAHALNADGLSSATIRNVMAELSEVGLLEQPHTSAGRIPTALAFRQYVNVLESRQSAHEDVLPKKERDRIDEHYTGVVSTQDFLERTSHVLALVSSGMGVTLLTTGEVTALEHIHFTRLAPGKVLAVLVTRSGTVQDRVLALDRDISTTELDIAANYLNTNFHGWTLARLRDEISQRIQRERSEYDRILRDLDELWRKGALERQQGQSVFFEGVANLISGEGGPGRDELRQMLSALEEKQRLVELLTAYVDANQESVRVVVGLEAAVPQMGNYVLIGAPARLAGEVMGSVAVIGPTRMHYESAMQTVSYVAKLFDHLIEGPPLLPRNPQ
jgi:heat-inducible transcriptional repressor